MVVGAVRNLYSLDGSTCRKSPSDGSMQSISVISLPQAQCHFVFFHSSCVLYVEWMGGCLECRHNLNERKEKAHCLIQRFVQKNHSNGYTKITQQKCLFYFCFVAITKLNTQQRYLSFLLAQEYNHALFDMFLCQQNLSTIETIPHSSHSNHTVISICITMDTITLSWFLQQNTHITTSAVSYQQNLSSMIFKVTYEF